MATDYFSPISQRLKESPSHGALHDVDLYSRWPLIHNCLDILHISYKLSTLPLRQLRLWTKTKTMEATIMVTSLGSKSLHIPSTPHFRGTGRRFLHEPSRYHWGKSWRWRLGLGLCCPIDPPLLAAPESPATKRWSLILEKTRYHLRISAEGCGGRGQGAASLHMWGASAAIHIKTIQRGVRDKY